MKRGEIRWYEFKPPNKKRPVIILTRDSVISYMRELTIAPITSVIRDIPTEVHLNGDVGLPKMSVVNLDHVQTVDKSKIGKLIGKASTLKMREINAAIAFALGME